MRDSVEVFGTSLSRCARPHGPPRPMGPSTGQMLETMADDGARVIKRTLLLGAGLALGALAWGAASVASPGDNVTDGAPHAHPP